jgi:hypothetical protein
MCPRDVVTSVGSLLLNSVIIGTFIGPIITLVLGSQTKRQVQESIVRLVIPSYVVKKAVVSGEDLVGELVFLMEEPLFLGICVPLLIPLVCVSVAVNSVTFNLLMSQCGVECNNDNKIPRIDGSLIVAAIMGYAFVVWFFFSCDLQGAWLVLFGAPFCALGLNHSHKPQP